MAHQIMRPLKAKKKEEEPAIKQVRGGSICKPGEGGAHLIRGTRQPAICRTTPGIDPRPRWRVAGKH